VRKGNPKQIRDWDDLVKPGVEVVTPNPKTSGGARWNYLAAWAFGLHKHAQDEARARNYVAELYRHVPILDSGARGATTTFVERRIGDVLLTWENEAKLCIQKLGADLELVLPSLSILAEPPVAVVDRYAKKHRTEQVGRAYLEFLFSKEAQQVAMRHFYRPRDEALLAAASKEFPPIRQVTIADSFGGWANAQKRHFDEGGEFDRMYQPGRR
jgi:sulfate/thiosulfate transport system substrate-binding protein